MPSVSISGERTLLVGTPLLARWQLGSMALIFWALHVCKPPCKTFCTANGNLGVSMQWCRFCQHCRAQGGSPNPMTTPPLSAAESSCCSRVSTLVRTSEPTCTHMRTHVSEPPPCGHHRSPCPRDSSPVIECLAPCKSRLKLHSAYCTIFRQISYTSSLMC